jgi:hypothetical protein
MSLIGDAFGFIGAGRAANSVSNANIAAEHGVLNAGETGAEGALGSAASGSAAVGGALGNYQPFNDAGATGLTDLQSYVASNPQFSFTPSQYFNSPAYQFQLQEGSNAIKNSASAMGLGESGNTLRDLTQYGQGLAAQYYNQAFNQAQSTFQTNQNATLANLSTLIGAGEFGAQGTLGGTEFQAGLGENANQYAGTLRLNAAQDAGQFAVGAGQAHASGIENQYASLTSGIADLASLGAGLAGLPGYGGG